MIDSVFKTGNNHYYQVLLEECKYVLKEKKMSKYMIDDIEISSDFDRDNSNEENSDEENWKNTYIVKLIFKAYKNNDEIFFNHFFSSIYKC